MDHYWVIARARRFPEERAKRIEAKSRKDAREQAERWRKEDLGNWEVVAIAKEIPNLQHPIASHPKLGPRT